MKYIAIFARQKFEFLDELEIQLSETNVTRDIAKTLFCIFDTNGDCRIDFGEVIIFGNLFNSNHFIYFWNSF